MYNRCNCGHQMPHMPHTMNTPCNAPCKCEPIVLEPRTCVVNRYFPVEQPIICPTHTKVINNYVPTPRYYPQHTTSEEDRCCSGTMPTNR